MVVLLFKIFVDTAHADNSGRLDLHDVADRGLVIFLHLFHDFAIYADIIKDTDLSAILSISNGNSSWLRGRSEQEFQQPGGIIGLYGAFRDSFSRTEAPGHGRAAYSGGLRGQHVGS